MQLVVDANPVISILIRPGLPVDLIYLEKLSLIAPGLLFEEIKKNKREIIAKSSLDEKEVDRFISILRKKISVIPGEEYLAFREKAESICPDDKDVIYFALALSLQCSLWSNEKKLKSQDEVTVYATHELIELFGLKNR